MSTIEPPNPYAPPRAELDVPAAPPAAMPANLEGAMAGRYDFTIGEVMDEAWQHVKGMKATFWGAAIVFFLFNFAVNRASGRILEMFVAKPHLVVQLFFRSVVGALTAPVTIGMTMMCVRRALGAPISFKTAFSHYGRSLPVFGAAVVMVVLTWAGLLILVLPGIYFWIAYSFALPLVCDHGLSPWQALETSRRAVKHKWFSLFGLTLLVGVLTCVSALGLLIPLIWTLPWSMMTTAVAYRRIFYGPMPGAPVAAPSIPLPPGSLR